MKEAILNLQTDWNEDNMKSLILKIIELFKKWDDELIKDTYINKMDNLEVKWIKSSFAKCAPYTGILFFGERLFKNSFTYGSFGYAKEQKYMKARCEDRVQLLIWVIVHEYCHIFKDRQKHTNSFFEFVDKKYVKLLWYNLITKREIL